MKTPHSLDLLTVGALTLLFSASAADVDECAQVCPADYAPLCGDNGVFYSNDCFRSIDECLTGTTIVDVGNLGCELIGGTMGFDEPDFPNEEPPGTWELEWPTEGSSSGSTSSSGSASSSDGELSIDDNGDSDDSSTPVSLPPGVVVDDNAPPSSDFVPTNESVAPGVVLDDNAPRSSDFVPTNESVAPGVVVDDNAPPSSDFVPTNESVAPGVVVDDNAPPSSDFVPTNEPVAASDSNDTVIVVMIDPPVLSEPFDLDDQFMETAEYTDSSGASDEGSGSGSDRSGSDDSDDSAQCEILCLATTEPVCATNGVTYSNPCELSKMHCIDPTIKSLHPGDCSKSPSPTPEPTSEEVPATPFPVAEGDDPCAYLCSMWNHPVCSEDGHVYANDCVYQSALCRDATLQPASDALCTPAVDSTNNPTRMRKV